MTTYRLPLRTRVPGAAHHDEHRAARDARYREAHREERRAQTAAYWATHREESRAYATAYSAAHREERRASSAATHANHSAKLAGAAGRITAADVVAAWAAGLCAYCGGDGLSLDHVVPLSRGGANEPANLVRCCGPCNSSKNDRTPEEWRRLTGTAIPYRDTWL